MINHDTPNEELQYNASLDPISPLFDIRTWDREDEPLTDAEHFAICDELGS